MILFPELQIERGRLRAAVELPGGLDDPLVLAEHCAEQGAGFLHVVDRDGSPESATAIGLVTAAFPGHVQLELSHDGEGKVAEWFDAGIARLVIGHGDPDRAISLARDWPGGIAVALDVDTVEHAIGYARHFAMSELAALVLTDPARRGTKGGADVDKMLEILHRTDNAIVWRGGVRSLGELRLMALQSERGLEGVICGRALLEGPLDLPSALAMAERN